MPVWHLLLTKKQHYALERIQKRSCRIMLVSTYSHYKEALITCNIPELKLRRDIICLDFAKKLYTSTEFRKWLPKLRSEATGHSLVVPKNDHSKVTYKKESSKPPRGGGFSLTNEIRGCSKVLRCIFVNFGISMGGLSSHTQCPQFEKLGVFWKS